MLILFGEAGKNSQMRAVRSCEIGASFFDVKIFGIVFYKLSAINWRFVTNFVHFLKHSEKRVDAVVQV